MGGKSKPLRETCCLAVCSVKLAVADAYCLYPFLGLQNGDILPFHFILLFDILLQERLPLINYLASQ